MNLDDPVCLCFHVTRRKVLSFIRIEKPRKSSQLSECFGAGTGCGWCRPYLERMLKSELEQMGLNQNLGPGTEQGLESGEKLNEAMKLNVSFPEYSRQRAEYVRRGGGTPPPGAIPLEGHE